MKSIIFIGLLLPVASWANSFARITPGKWVQTSEKPVVSAMNKVRSAQLKVGFKKFEIERVSNGFHISYDDVCEKVIDVDVYDMVNAGAIVIPVTPLVTCRSTLGTDTVNLGALAFISLENGELFPSEGDVNFKSYLSHFTVTGAEGAIIQMEDFNLSSTRDMKLGSQVAHLSVQKAISADLKEGFFATLEFVD